MNFALWDTAGQERFRSVTTHHYRGANAALLVYDVGAGGSLRSLEGEWLNEVKTHLREDAVLAVVANKCDLPDYTTFENLQSGRAFSQKIGAMFFETSVFDESVRAAICCVLAKVLATHGEGEKVGVLRLTDGRDVDCTKDLLGVGCCGGR